MHPAKMVELKPLRYRPNHEFEREAMREDSSGGSTEAPIPVGI